METNLHTRSRDWLELALAQTLKNLSKQRDWLDDILLIPLIPFLAKSEVVAETIESVAEDQNRL